jgi:hypothetical protein
MSKDTKVLNKYTDMHKKMDSIPQKTYNTASIVSPKYRATA